MTNLNLHWQWLTQYKFRYIVGVSVCTMDYTGRSDKACVSNSNNVIYTTTEFQLIRYGPRNDRILIHLMKICQLTFCRRTALDLLVGSWQVGPLVSQDAKWQYNTIHPKALTIKNTLFWKYRQPWTDKKGHYKYFCTFNWRKVTINQNFSWVE